MKRAFLAVSLFAMTLAAVWSQPKVAVLDAIIPQNMDPSVIVPVTEKIAERLVVSGRFTVLDRANVEAVLKEREFEMSGLVSDQEVVKAGQYLGADFVVAPTVRKIEETYFITAKMIAIKTGIIANQTSAQAEGKLSTLIDLASQVGEVLSGGAVLAQSAAGGQRDISKPDTSRAKASTSGTAETETPPKPADKLRTTLLGSFGGSSGSVADNTATINGAGVGGDVFVLVPLFGGFSLVASADLLAFTSVDNSSIIWAQDDFLAGVGFALRLGPIVPYVDVKAGLAASTLTITDSFGVTTPYSGSGGAYGFDLGLNWNIGRWFVLGARYQYVGGSVLYDTFTKASDLSHGDFLVSAGIRF